MIIKIKVNPGKNKEKIEKVSEDEYIIDLTERAEDNKANIELFNLLKRHFNVPVKNIKIIKGKTSRKKIIEIIDL
ncbi:MAG: DUF167 domain-containing protein [Candidatus Pacearchaeota archaeon]